MNTLWLLIVFILQSPVKAKPSCKVYGTSYRTVVCKPGDSNYVLERGLVSDNNSTMKIVLRGCRISEVNLESFENLPSLKHLDLSQNKIQELKLGVLDEALNVTHLNLSSNLLTGFPLGLFDQKPNLITLDLSGNLINSLELGIFDPLTKLKSLYLSANLLVGKDISPFLFDESPHITLLDFSSNDMSKSPDNLLHAFESLETLNLSRCLLTEVPKFATTPNLKTIKHLTLSINQIHKIESAATFLNLHNLEKLDLAQNNLEFINENVFSSLKKLRGIVLRSNKLQLISNNLFKNLPKLVTIDLANNFLTFFGVDGLKGTSLKNLNLSDNRLTFLQENFCLELKNAGVTLVKFLFIPNPWHCACLNELLREVKSMNIVYNSAYFDGKHSVCIATDKFVCDRSLVDM
ncbi:unnamed protein product [Parnassius mnemosyne]|uniref:Uncharacterized protein n=1 Tax=Parnassius mnemosyne TaxID=213953 RepID=A0AAV1LJY9_9NEOP